MKECSGWGTRTCEQTCYIRKQADDDGRYVRMIGSPALYNVGADYLEDDAALVQKRGTNHLTVH